MKSKEVYTGNISVSFILLLGYYFYQHIAFFLVGMSILFLSLVSETIARYIALGLNKLFGFIGAINSRIILSIFYLGILFPISFLKRIVTKKDKVKNTKWINTIDKSYNFKELW
jgi:hypothetical protein